MIAAARKAARALKRDFGEVENLQVSLKGPANFVTAADRRAEEMLHAELARRGPATASSARKAAATRAPTRPTPGSSIRSTAPPTSCTASRSSPSRSGSSAKARRRRRDLQSGHRRAVHRRARQGRLPQRPAAAGRGAQAARRRGGRLRRCRIVGRGDLALGLKELPRCRTRSRACAASARPRSISPVSRPAGSTATGSATSRRGTSRPASLVREAGGFVTDLDGGDAMFAKRQYRRRQRDVHRELLAAAEGRGKT